MSRSHFKAPKEIPIPNDVIPGNVMRCRRNQYRVHRKSGGSTHSKLGKTTVHYPPYTGWPGGDWKQNMGFKTPQVR